MNFFNNKKETRHSAVSKQHCDDMAKRYGWEQPEEDKDRYEKRNCSILPIDCIFIGDCQFPVSSMDQSQGDIHNGEEE